jgi:hypothetical protein
MGPVMSLPFQSAISITVIGIKSLFTVNSFFVIRIYFVVVSDFESTWVSPNNSFHSSCMFYSASTQWASSPIVLDELNKRDDRIIRCESGSGRYRSHGNFPRSKKERYLNECSTLENYVNYMNCSCKKATGEALKA